MNLLIMLIGTLEVGALTQLVATTGTSTTDTWTESRTTGVTTQPGTTTGAATTETLTMTGMLQESMMSDATIVGKKDM